MKGIFVSRSGSSLLLLFFFVLGGFFLNLPALFSRYEKIGSTPLGGPSFDTVNAAGALSASFSPFNVSFSSETISESVPTPESVVEVSALSSLGNIFEISHESETKLVAKPFFSFPVFGGKNWGKLHQYNAVDIAGNCGTPIYAAADGIVRESVQNDLWNGGYGNYVIIDHENKTATKYAHTLKNFVPKGVQVTQGDKIATIGNSGNVDGVSGCHLHFEVYGGTNPFVQK